MLAMLRKDLYVMGRYTAYLILSWLVVTWAANSISADEGRWDRFAAVTPLRPWQIVPAKYLFAYGCLAVMTALAALAGGGGVKLWTVAAITPLVLAMALPLLYRFGRQRGSIVLLL